MLLVLKIKCPYDKEYRRPLEAGKSKEMNFPLDLSEDMPSLLES
jgi:hypothetical protein